MKPFQGASVYTCNKIGMPRWMPAHTAQSFPPHIAVRELDKSMCR